MIDAAQSGPGRPLLLASSSKYRAELLSRLGLPFEQASPDIDETPAPGELPADLVMRLARDKGEALRTVYAEHLIISSDQVASIDDLMLGKPGTVANAIAQLERLSGRTVTFYTSLQLLDARAPGTQAAQRELDITEVRFRKLSRQQIEDYVQRESPLDCAGAFKSEGLGIALFDAINTTDPSALIGLPLIRLCGLLAAMGQPVLGKH